MFEDTPRDYRIMINIIMIYNYYDYDDLISSWPLIMIMIMIMIIIIMIMFVIMFVIMIMIMIMIMIILWL